MDQPRRQREYKGKEKSLVKVASFPLKWLLLLLICAPRDTSEENITSETVSGPLASFFVRQETALRKLDALTVKVSKVDTLEAKLDEVTNLLKAQQERNAQLEARFAIMEAQLEQTSGKITSLNDSMNVVGSNVRHVGERIEASLSPHVNNNNNNQQRKDVALLYNLTETAVHLMKDSATNLTLATENVIQDAKQYMQDMAVTIVANKTEIHSQFKDTVTQEWKESIKRSEDLFESQINNTKHLIASLFSHVRLSSLAMDKRLGALLHTSSSRQRLLQETIMAAIASVATLVRTQTQDILRKVESRLVSVEDSLAVSAKRHAKELATLVLEVANHTLSDISSSTDVQLNVLLHAQVNNTAHLADALDVLYDLHNLTVSKQTDANDDYCASCQISETLQNTSRIECTQHLTEPLEEKVSQLQAEVSTHLEQVEEKLAGLRIYHSTGLHLQTQQVTEVLREVLDEMKDSLEVAQDRSLQLLEKLRNSALGHLDAAVTSISSAAVASAQATANQLTEALQEVTDQLGNRLDKIDFAVSQVSTKCLPQYTQVGDICLLALPDALVTWTEAQALCQQLGGDLAMIPDRSKLEHFERFLYSIRNREFSNPPSYWVGGRRLGQGEWVWLTGRPIEAEVRSRMGLDISLTSEGVEVESITEECLVFREEMAELLSAPCDSAQAILCQYHHISSPLLGNLTNSGFIDNEILIPQTGDYFYIPNEGIGGA